MLTRLCMLATKRALFSSGQKRSRDARTYFRISRQNLTFGEVFVGCLPVENCYVCAVPAVFENASSYALRKIPFYYLELAKGLEPPTL
jgi:hypothetical protein